jgi:hypothetical protein
MKGRYKALIFAAQQTETAIGVAALNRTLAAGRRRLSLITQLLHRKIGWGVISLPSVKCINSDQWASSGPR